MSILDYLFGRTPRHGDPVPEIVVTLDDKEVARWTIDLEVATTIKDEAPSTNKPTSAARKNTDVDRFDTEPIYCAIDYTDAVGARSHRRITVRSVEPGRAAPCLNAFCHERKAIRRFRVDRIERIITTDGEVYDPPDFLRDVCGYESIYRLAAPAAEQANVAIKNTPYVWGRKEKGDAAVIGRRRFVGRLRPAITILIAAARSDDHLHPQEKEAILLYAEREAMALRQEKHIPAIPDIGVFDAISRRVSHTRPMTEDLAKAFPQVLDWEQNSYGRFCEALRAVIRADGKITMSEEVFLSELMFLHQRLRDKATKEFGHWYGPEVQTYLDDEC